MKGIYLLLWVCSILSRPAIATDLKVAEETEVKVLKSRIEGKLSGCDGTQVFLVRKGTMSITLSRGEVKNGRFAIEVSLDEPVFLSLNIPSKISADLWVIPGHDLRLEETDKGIVYQGAGKAINQMLSFLDRKYAVRMPENSRRPLLDEARSGCLSDIYQDKLADVNKADLSETDRRLVLGYLQGDLLNRLYEQITMSKIFGKSYPQPERREGYARQVLNLELLPEITRYSMWKEGVDEWLYDRMRAGIINIKSLDSRVADLAEGIVDPALREAYILKTFQTELNQGNLVGIRQRMAAVRPLLKEPANLKMLDGMEQKAEQEELKYQSVLPGTDLSRYSFYSAQGDTVALGDFKGKYVFIDLWSTACNPCIGEIPYIREMEHRFAGEPIVWVSISMDLHENVWKEFLKKQNMHGVHLLLDKGYKHPFCQQIVLRGIPRFLLLDKQGCVVDYNTLRPSNPVLGACVELLLKN